MDVADKTLRDIDAGDRFEQVGHTGSCDLGRNDELMAMAKDAANMGEELGYDTLADDTWLHEMADSDRMNMTSVDEAMNIQQRIKICPYDCSYRHLATRMNNVFLAHELDSPELTEEEALGPRGGVDPPEITAST